MAQYLTLIEPIFGISPSSSGVTWLWIWQKHQLWRVDCQCCTGLIYL